MNSGASESTPSRLEIHRKDAPGPGATPRPTKEMTSPSTAGFGSMLWMTALGGVGIPDVSTQMVTSAVSSSPCESRTVSVAVYWPALV